MGALLRRWLQDLSSLMYGTHPYRRHALSLATILCIYGIFCFFIVYFVCCSAGLTSRPTPAQGKDNPYSMSFQSELLLQLCSTLGLERAILVAHADGSLLALRAVALAARWVLYCVCVCPCVRVRARACMHYATR